MQQVTLPSTLKALGSDAFRDCPKLKRVALADGSALERIESDCFYKSGLEEITLPKSLKRIE